MSEEGLCYVVGEEKRLTDLLAESEVVPLLQGIVRAGACEAAVIDDAGRVLWASRHPERVGGVAGTLPLLLEGEPVGRLVIRGEAEKEEYLKGLGGLLRDLLTSLLSANLKRMLTTEMHTRVVNQSYDELLETNRLLAVSEERYRSLAGRLEEEVAKQTGELARAHVQLIQREKMASVGQLAAGIAHEINNPIGFVMSNLATLQKYVARFVVMLDFYRGAMKDDRVPAELVEHVREKWRDLKLDLVCSDVGDLLTQSIEGSERVKRIVADLKGFSHVDDLAETEVDLNEELARTLAVMAPAIPPGTEVVREFRPIPPLRCRGGELGQAFFNIIRNAVQARGDGLRLVISTFEEGRQLVVGFADNGPGIPAEQRTRIFEPFFTTREVGGGTGLGLTVVYEAVTACGGTVEVGSSAMGGALFTLRLPLAR